MLKKWLKFRRFKTKVKGHRWHINLETFGGGIFSKLIHTHHSSIFQMEVSAMQIALNIINDANTRITTRGVNMLAKWLLKP